MSKFNKRYVRIFSRHPSHKVIRRGGGNEVLFNQLACIRLGSTTPKSAKWNRTNLQINSIDAIKASSNKLKMKAAFLESGIISPEFWINRESIPEEAFPIIAKKVFGSRASGIKLIENKDILDRFAGRGYYYEKYYNYTREYRMHCSPVLNKMFYTCRKMLQKNTPEEVKFYRNDSNCKWFLESNPNFNKPPNWDQICEEAIKAVDAVGLDIGAVDVRVRGKSKNNINPFQIIEVNSAPSFGKITAIKYQEIILEILKEKEHVYN